jgi:hypothetical protein
MASGFDEHIAEAAADYLALNRGVPLSDVRYTVYDGNEERHFARVYDGDWLVFSSTTGVAPRVIPVAENYRDAPCMAEMRETIGALTDGAHLDDVEVFFCYWLYNSGPVDSVHVDHSAGNSVTRVTITKAKAAACERSTVVKSATKRA